MPKYGAFMQNKKGGVQAQTGGTQAPQQVEKTNLQNLVQAPPAPVRGAAAGLIGKALERTKAPKVGAPPVPVTTPVTELPSQPAAPPSVRPPRPAGVVPQPRQQPVPAVGGYVTPMASPVAGGLAGLAPQQEVPQMPQPAYAPPAAGFGGFESPYDYGLRAVGGGRDAGSREAAPWEPGPPLPLGDAFQAFYGDGGFERHMHNEQVKQMLENMIKSGYQGPVGTHQETMLEKTEDKVDELLAGDASDFGFTAEELAAQDEAVDKWQAQAAYDLSEQMAARGMGASGIAAHGMGQIASQAESMKLDLRVKNKQLAIDARIKELNAFLGFYGNQLSIEKQAELQDELMKLNSQRESAADIEAIKNNILADLKGDRYDTEALSWIDKALNEGMSQSDVIANLDVGADGTVTVIDPNLGMGDEGDEGDEDEGGASTFAKIKAGMKKGEYGAGEIWESLDEYEKEELKSYLYENKLKAYLKKNYSTEDGVFQWHLALEAPHAQGDHPLRDNLTELFGVDPEVIFGPEWVDVLREWTDEHYPSGA